jgi:alanine dehydrogenase
MTGELLYLPRAEVEELLPPLADQLELVEGTYLAMGDGGVELPPKPGIHPRPNAFIHAMPAYLRGQDVAAVKWIAGYRANKARGLPYLNGLIIVSDPETGLPVAVMDAVAITASRTAVASGVCIRRWAPRGWRTAAILGCGVQGARHARVLQMLNDELVLKAFDPNLGRAEGLLDGAARACRSPREAVEGSEIVITTGPMPERREPVLASDWLAPRHLLLPVDFDAYVQPDAISDAELFLVDDVDQFEYYRRQGYFQGWPPARAGLGEALGSRIEASRVACVNLGVGALDAVLAKQVLDAAGARGVGTRLPL